MLPVSEVLLGAEDAAKKRHIWFSARKLLFPVERRRQTVSFPSLEGSNLKTDNKLTGKQAND